MPYKAENLHFAMVFSRNSDVTKISGLVSLTATIKPIAQIFNLVLSFFTALLFSAKFY